MKSDSRRGRAASVLALLLAFNACGLDKVQVPELDGPSELGLSVKVTITPDVVTADGFSTALIQATVRDQNGQTVAGRSLFFAIEAQGGLPADIGTLYDQNGQQLSSGTAIVRTAGNGVAQVVYQTPARTDATANQTVVISVRPVGDDFNGQIYRTVRLELRSAEPRLFPVGPTGTPTCNFIVEAPGGYCSAPKTCSVRTNTAVLFQSTASDSGGTIVRYEWFFGDGTGITYAPDTAHVFQFSGTYVVTHLVTNDRGGQSACQATLTAN